MEPYGQVNGSSDETLYECGQQAMVTDNREGDPDRFWKRREKAEPFPMEAFPAIIRNAVTEYHSYGQQPLGLVCTSALAALSLACQGHADVRRDRHLVGPISLNTLVVAESGERKSSADDFFSKPIKDWLKDYRAQIEPEVKASQAEHQAWRAKCKGLLKAIEASERGAGKSDKYEIAYAELMQTEPEKITMPEMFYADVNPASLGAVLSHGYPSASIWSAEAGTFVGSHGMQSETVMAFMSMLNQLWDCGEYANIRKTVESTRIRGRRVSCSLMMQPAVVKELLQNHNGLSRGIGLLARFLLCWPQSTIGRRLYTKPPENWQAPAAFNTRLNEILNQPLSTQDGLSPTVIPLSHGARSLWIDYFNKIEKRLSGYNTFSEVRDFGSKAAENAARIAGIFHVFLNGPGSEISQAVMGRAVIVATWYLEEARRIFGLVDRPQVEKDAECLLGWLAGSSYAIQNNLPDGKAFNPRQVLQYGPSSLRSKSRRDPALDLLAETRWVRRIDKRSYLLHAKARKVADELS